MIEQIYIPSPYDIPVMITIASILVGIIFVSWYYNRKAIKTNGD